MKDDAKAAFRVGPSDCAFFVADEVAGATLVTVLIVEQDAAVTSGHKRLAGQATTHSRVVQPRQESSLTVMWARS